MEHVIENAAVLVFSSAVVFADEHVNVIGLH